MEEAWDRASSLYLERRGSDTRSVSYGNLAPSENELRLLGDLRGLRVLDIGCGGGENAISCARAGAEVTGVDISDVQLQAARNLAQRQGVAVEWLHGESRLLEKWAGAPFDLVLAIQVLPYIEQPAALLATCRRLLRPGGRLVVSFDHPLRNCFWDREVNELSPYPVRSYFDTQPLYWSFATGVPMAAHHQPLSQWVGWVAAAGLHLQQLVEAAAPPEVAEELWPEDSPLYLLRAIPHTAILVARNGG